MKEITELGKMAVALQKVEHIAGLSTSGFCVFKDEAEKGGKKEEKIKLMLDFCWRNRHVKRKIKPVVFKS